MHRRECSWDEMINWRASKRRFTRWWKVWMFWQWGYTHMHETFGKWVKDSIQTEFYYNHSQCCKIHFWVRHRWSAYISLSRVEYRWPVYIPPRFHEFWNTQLSYTKTMSFTNTKTFRKTKAGDQTRGRMMKLCKEKYKRSDNEGIHTHEWNIWKLSRGFNPDRILL